MKYFATDAHFFEELGMKIKAGQILDIPEELAQALIREVPGILQKFEAAIHTPAPVVETPVVESEAPVAAEEPVVAPESEEGEAA